MNQRFTERLDKVIAMADSSHEGEAVAAVRKARELLSRGGLSFGDLAQAFSLNAKERQPASLQAANLDVQLFQLRQSLNEAQAELQVKDEQIETWRRRALELKQALNHKEAETERWRSLAQDTVDSLWNLGQSLKNEEFSAARVEESASELSLPAAEK